MSGVPRQTTDREEPANASGPAERADSRPHPAASAGQDTPWPSPRARTAREIQVEALRRMTPGQRISCALRWSRLSLELMAWGVRRMHPEWPRSDVLKEVMRRISLAR